MRLLTAAARDRLNHLPAQIPNADRRAVCLLTAADPRVINQPREAHTRLGVALPLCAVRDLGCAPADLHTTPSAVVADVARPWAVPPEAIHADGRRRNTRTSPLVQLPMYRGCRLATPLARDALQTWLEERAFAPDNPTLRLQLACDQRRRDQIGRPGLTRLKRLLATARPPAHLETCRRLTPLLTEAQVARLDGLRGPDPGTGRTRLHGLRRDATATTAPQRVEALTQGQCLRQAGMHTWELTALHPNRVPWRAPLGWQAPVPQRQRMDPRRRSPLLVAFLQQALVHHTAVAVELSAQGVWAYDRAAQQALKDLRQTLARSTTAKLRLWVPKTRRSHQPAGWCTGDDAARRSSW
jgi:hypothetical protein